MACVPPERTWTIVALLAATLLLTGWSCEPNNNRFVACLSGDQTACKEFYNPPPPPGLPVAPVPGKPSPPLGLTLTVTARGVSLDWADNPESDVVGYNVFRATYTRRGDLYEVTAGSPSSSDFADVAMFENSTTYFYAVTARDVENTESERSGLVSLVYCPPGGTCPRAPGPPAAPTGLAVVSHDDVGLTLDWNDNAEPDLDRYYVYRKDTTGGAYREALWTTKSETELSSGLSGFPLVPFTTYSFVVTAADTDGDGLEGEHSAELSVFYCPASVTGCPAAPPATTGLRLIDRDAAGISLDWDDNDGPTFARFVVYHKEVGQERRVGFPTDSFFRHRTPSHLSNSYWVAAMDAEGRLGPRSNGLAVEWCGPADPTCATAPAAPTGLTATPGPYQVALDWTDNTEADLAGYNVEHSYTGSDPWNQANRELLTVSQFTMYDLPDDRPSHFRVTAVDTDDNVSAPASVSATPCPTSCGRFLGTLAAVRPTRAAAGPGSSSFKLTVSARLSRAGVRRLEGATIVGRGDAVRGSFSLAPALKGLDRKLRRLASRKPRGTWRAKVDWRMDPIAHKATTTGLALATFGNRKLGAACLRFVETSTVKTVGKKRRLSTRGKFTLLSGTRTAAQLLGAGSYELTVRPGGAMVYRGKVKRAKRAARGLPAVCRALARR